MARLTPIGQVLVFKADHQYAYETELTSMWTHDPYLKNKRIARCGCFADEVGEQIKRWEANGNDLFPREIFAPGGEWPPVIVSAGGLRR